MNKKDINQAVDLPSDISESLRNALIEYFEETGSIPPRRKWPVIFGPEMAQENENQWMLM